MRGGPSTTRITGQGRSSDSVGEEDRRRRLVKRCGLENTARKEKKRGAHTRVLKFIKNVGQVKTDVLK